MLVQVEVLGEAFQVLEHLPVHDVGGKGGGEGVAGKVHSLLGQIRPSITAHNIDADYDKTIVGNVIVYLLAQSGKKRVLLYFIH